MHKDDRQISEDEFVLVNKSELRRYPNSHSVF